jgi:hypothetical protein
MDKLFPARESLVSDIPAGDGKTAKPFFTVWIPGGEIHFDFILISRYKVLISDTL